MKKKTTYWSEISMKNLSIKKYMILAMLALLFPLVSFSQTVYTFSNAGASGKTGPTQAQVTTAYTATTLAGAVTVTTQGIQEWTVPVTGIYKIEALGAQGGDVNINCVQTGGLGAKMSGNFSLTAGQVIKIIVGQTGLSNNRDGGGGGGSFVVNSANSPLVVAGGGGGATTNVGSCGAGQLNGLNAVITTNGTASGNNDVAGGINGNGGSSNGGGAGGGGGLLTNGEGSGNGLSFLNGGIGGNGGDSNHGGFGGGGSGWYYGGNGGGGGGYSGGGTSSNNPWTGGGGGGSYNSGTNQVNLAGANSGNGSVVITNLFTASISQTADVVCNTDSTGKLSVAITGGTAPFTYSWSPNVSSTSTASNLTKGTYNVTVTDGNSVAMTVSFTIVPIDNTAPVFSPLANITKTTDSGSCGAVVNYPETTKIVFSESFTQGQASSSCGNWNGFLSQLLPTLSYKKLTIKGSSDPIGVSINDPAKILQIANGLRTGTFVSVVNGSRTWVTGQCGSGIELNASLSGNVCDCNSGDYVVRPCIGSGNSNWGGAGTATCFGISQTLTVEFEIEDSVIAATDNCDSNPVVVQIAGLPSGSVFPLGKTTNTFRATDVNGNSSTSSFDVVVTDNQIPVITSNGDQTVNTDSGVCGANVTVSAAATDNCTVGSPSGVRSDAKLLTDVYPVGNTTITWNVSDANGNAATAVTQTITVTDNEIPVIASNGDQTVNTDSGVCGANVTVSAAATDNCTVGSPSGVRSDAKLLTDVYPVGITTITWNVSDANGNAATAVTQTITVADNEIPVIASNGNKTVNTDSGVCGASVTVSAAATDNCTVGSPSGVRSDAKLLTDVYPVGITTITWNVSDANGNAATAVTQTITVTDNEIPVIASNGDQTVNTDSGVCGANVTVSAAATDNCTVGSPSGVRSDAKLLTDVYPAGVTTITWNVSDANGNAAVTVTQTVTVIDNILPTVITKNFTAQLDASGNAVIQVSDVNNNSSDNCGIDKIELDKTSFTCANVGANTVTLKVTDIHGNISSRTATVTVQDKIAPVVLTQDLTIQLDASGKASITAAQIDNGSSDNCGITAITVSPNTFNCSNVGENEVTLKVTDVNGNIATEIAIVTVQDVVLPTAQARNITIDLDDAGNASITANEINNGSSDNCGIASMSLSKSSFDCTNVGVNTVVLTITDKNGNASSVSAAVTVRNTFGDNDKDGVLDNCDPDDDNDGILDVNDNCPITANPYQEDRNHNGIGDACDKDQMNISEAFTPNGDGINDTWVISNIENYPNSIVRVFNRWGAEVFTARNYQNDWDGRAKGNASTLPAASSYFYQIDLDGNGTIDKQGWIYINR
ncbi:gliding motility-associated-like protein [Flavobacterium sp. HSC-32F16]|uniref:T9SS type B sorting domain-containing protein n=1 Tax=Flavobacterium sp. HSC-32F16 TaxID=2910964 RepID=UPI0020A46A1A|nr:gliding motility-associated C-terminal domain-containing protein [Flavobacterium sp. HSC-32F16]MCP2029287.1 gliding motility-associated-like protein [Flavobacterium sp. HSC-32F16]